MDNNAQPLHICVITPTHNRIDYLPEAIASVRNNVKTQNAIDFTYEHCISANGCTDGTNEWLERASKEEGTPVKYSIDHVKQLPGAARNAAIHHFVPDHAWIALLDDDDVMLQRNLYYYAYLAKHNPDRQWFINDFVRVDSELRYKAKEDYYHWKFDSPVEMLKEIFKGNCFAQGNVCFSKKIFDEPGGYHEKLKMAEDLDLYVRFLLAGHLPGYSSHISHLHRCHAKNISIGVDAEKHRDDLETIYERYEDKLKALGVEYLKKSS